MILLKTEHSVTQEPRDEVLCERVERQFRRSSIATVRDACIHDIFSVQNLIPIAFNIKKKTIFLFGQAMIKKNCHEEFNVRVEFSSEKYKNYQFSDLHGFIKEPILTYFHSAQEVVPSENCQNEHKPWQLADALKLRHVTSPSCVSICTLPK